ncbi:hypothetical protein [Marinoscillum sp. MHG1-6]|uniref:hypothetical protein n=1 Tax=Marinoscillum sp. MHG1-6 TaxID=2959627 RepID=UPI00215843AA|nr:hypothetical protein [Marinoscillum sp. MHG1-6]
MTKEFETLGYYEPGFFHLKVNTDEDLSDLNVLMRNPDTKRFFSTFLHEYIHFLQDITTTSGLLSATFYIDFIKDVNWTIRNDGESEFKVPVEINNKNNIEANLKLREIYRGETKGSQLIKYDRYTVERKSIFDKDGQEINPELYKVHYYDLKTREPKTLNFGFACIKEYMAHAIQKKYIPDTDHADIPYQIAEQIVGVEYPEFGSDPMLVVALCDASLMCFHPAQMFFQTLKRMKEKKFIPQGTREIYDFAFKELTFQNSLGTETVETLFQSTIDLADKQLYDALQSQPFLPNYEWISYILKQAKNLRDSNPNFMCQLITDTGQLSDDFFEIFRLLGTPFFSNNKEKGGFVPPTNLKNTQIQPYQLLVFKQVIRVFYGHQSCSLYDFCKTRPDKDITNSHCLSSPWERAKEDELCPFAQIWKTWGLTNEIPTKK